MKRLFDLLAAICGLLLTGPLIAVLWALVRRDSPGPGVFSQERIGRNGVIFRCHKMRTMMSDSPAVPSHLADRSRITKVGRILRRTKLDELPQLWNVLKGEMSFVGPRPCLPIQVELVEKRRRLGVLDLRPGITGLAQVAGIDMSDPELLAQTDAEYMNTRSLLLDVKLILLTIFPIRKQR